MKNQLLLITIFCLISNLILSSDDVKINLATPDKTCLLEKAAQDICEKQKAYYWPENATIRLEGCYLLKDKYQNTENPRYKVCVIGHYQTSPREFITQAATIKYFKNELNEMGVDLPE
ncbi:MAG: hypothetical protein K2X69_09290 [Silvanigrellaceae bacterium]|nr:hypothetical protein [Silvanigrellaceae bacterium]